jgi:putative MFS transporter
MKKTQLALLAAALGYFVDLYDILIFTIVRTKSLLSIGITEQDLISVGTFLLNTQMVGMLVGGLFWGILGDKKGRLSVLFGSILMYSVANIANGFVTSIEGYATWRFLAGIGLAGELGAGLTLVSEMISKEKRGLGTTLINLSGIFGAMTGAVVGGWFAWQTAYFVGGGMGLLLLVFRLGVVESGMFEQVKQQNIRRGDFFSLFRSKKMTIKYLSILFIGAATWYLAAILLTFTPEISKGMGMEILPQVPKVVLFGYTGFALGNLSCGLLGQYLKSRKKALMIFVSFMAMATVFYFFFAGKSETWYYGCIFLIGFGTGKNASLFTIAAEQFGTNIRATATTSATNFIRAFAIPYALLFNYLQVYLGVVGSAAAVGFVAFGLAFWAMFQLEETFGKEMDYVE